MNKYNGSFRHLIVWQEATTLTMKIYELSKTFPIEEKYGITSQIRRASSSIMANIAEGNERMTKKDCSRFLEIALGSLVEVDCFIDLTFKLKYLSEAQYKQILNNINKTAFLIKQFKLSQTRNNKRK